MLILVVIQINEIGVIKVRSQFSLQGTGVEYIPLVAAFSTILWPIVLPGLLFNVLVHE